jgi:thymidylate kinase
MDDAFESFLYFSSRVASIYNHLSRRFRFVTVDAEQSIYDQHRFIRETYLSLQPETPAPYLFEPQSLLSQVDV